MTSLFVVSGVFGLFQGGIVPMYALICRELLPPREAGAKIGLVVSATIFGMAFGGYASGLIFDLTSSYRAAFFNGALWNAAQLRRCRLALSQTSLPRSRRDRLDHLTRSQFLHAKCSQVAIIVWHEATICG